MNWNDKVETTLTAAHKPK